MEPNHNVVMHRALRRGLEGKPTINRHHIHDSSKVTCPRYTTGMPFSRQISNGFFVLFVVKFCQNISKGGISMSASRVMKWITGGLEALLAIPVLGASIVISLAWVPLGIMLILHIITLVLSKKNDELIYGSVVGIVTSLVAWIPFVGFVMHVLSAVFLMVTAAKPYKANQGAAM
jgi:hypothetical protein